MQMKIGHFFSLHNGLPKGVKQVGHTALLQQLDKLLRTASDGIGPLRGCDWHDTHDNWAARVQEQSRDISTPSGTAEENALKASYFDSEVFVILGVRLGSSLSLPLVAPRPLAYNACHSSCKVANGSPRLING